MKHLYLFLAIIALSCGSCNKFLDTKPEGLLSPEYYYRNESEINTALAGIYSIMSDTRNEEPFYAASYISQMGTEGDDGYYRKGPERNIVGQFLYNASVPNLAALWQSLYEGINMANALLENLPKAEMTKEKKDIVQGETLFLRSYYYFMLVSNWGDVPLKLSSTTSATDNSIPRDPSAKVYDQITADMALAYDLLPTASSVGFGGRINKSTAAGILARVNLYRAGYPLNDKSKYAAARNWTEKVIKSNEHTLQSSYQQIFINYAADKYDVKESIWEVEFSGNRTERPRQAGLVGNYIGIRSTNDKIGNSNANVRASARLYRLYAAGDLRRDWCIAPFEYLPIESETKVNYAAADIFTRYAGKYRREYEVVFPKSKGYTPINYPLLRYADVLLMFAEADYQVNGGPTEEAIKYVNMVRRRGYGKDVTVASTEADLTVEQKGDFLQTIQDERSRELCFESLRRNDLIRWGIYVFSIKAMANDYETSSGVPSSMRTIVSSLKSVNSKHLFWPIPTHEISLNKALIQNTGW